VFWCESLPIIRLWVIKQFPFYNADLRKGLRFEQSDVVLRGKPFEMPLNCAKRQTGFHGNGFESAANYAGLAVGESQKVKIRPQACAHRLAVFAASVGCQAFPEWGPPTFTAFPQRQLCLFGWSFTNDLIESLHYGKNLITKSI